MDPLTVFPPEIVHQIWRHLTSNDLLAARAVAPHWLESVTDCPGAWVTDFSHDWTEFLSVKKAVRGWSSKSVRRQTVRNVRDCLVTEFAYYLLFGDGTLEMFSPGGNSVRAFHRPATDLHRGDRCLLIGVEQTKKNEPKTRHTTITDFALNYMDDMFDTEIIASSANGYAYRQNGECFFSLGPEIPGHQKTPCAPDAAFQFFASCAILVQGFTVKTVRLFDASSACFKTLKTSTSSPRWIPSVDIVPGPEDYFAVLVEQRDFNSVSVYRRDVPLFEDSYPSTFKCIFTEDYFVLSLMDTVTAFKLANFTKNYELDLPAHFNIKTIKHEPWSLIKNTFSVFNFTSSDEQWLVYRLSEARCRSPEKSSHRSEDAPVFKPKLQLLARNSTSPILVNGGLSVSEFEICPGYALNIQTKSGSGGNERMVHLLFFDI